MDANAKSYAIPQPTRGLIRVTGDDRATFLQGLVTADVENPPAGGLQYGCLLTAQGKFLHDFFLWHQDDAILIECEGGARAQDLHRRLSLYRLRAKVQMELRDDQYVWLTNAGGRADPRHVDLPRRTLERPEGAEERPFAAWDSHRIRLCVPDGSRDMAVERDTLLDCNIDRLGGVAFDKGCYVGQEITARMNYRGLVKKRLYAVEWAGEPPLAFTDIYVGETLVGQMRSACGAVGLAQLKIEAVEGGLKGADFTVLAGTRRKL